MFGSERQVHEGADRTIGAQQCVAQLEQGVAPRGQARVQLRPKRHHHRQRVSLNLMLDQSHDPGLRAALFALHRIGPPPLTHLVNWENTEQVRAPFDAGP